MDSTLPSNSFQVFLSRLEVAVLQVLFNCVIEEDSILGNDDDVFSERIEGVILDILTIYQHFTTLWVIYSEE